MVISIHVNNQNNSFKTSRLSVATALSRRGRSATVDGRKIALKSAAGLFDGDNADLGDHDDVAYKDDQPL